jgi:peptidoglycan/xylan/chitin deacetylase (PgdA/CDA1 family)
MILKWLFPQYTWNIPSSEKVIYLTFDDGPIPEVTPWVLQTLSDFHAKATFFCVGDNVRKHPDNFKAILDAGHTVGNHTHHHLNGWKTPLDVYLTDVKKAENYIASSLFRPPYGRLLPRQASALLESKSIIMWSVLTRDYAASLPPESCLRRSIKKTTPGAIVLFHDSLKAEKNLKYVLPRYLAHFKALGYRFAALPQK